MILWAFKSAHLSLVFSAISLMWRGGCIIRSVFLGKIKQAFVANPNLTNLLMDDFFAEEVARCQSDWRKIVAVGVANGIPMPAFSSGNTLQGLSCVISSDVHLSDS